MNNENNKTYSPSTKFSAHSHIDRQNEVEIRAQALKSPDEFWDQIAERLTWSKKWHQTQDCSFTSPVKINWYVGGQLNVAYNCVDRHAEKFPERVAFYWEPDDINETGRTITYKELKAEVSRMANVLKHLGVKKGDRVTIYLPMVPEAVFAMLACARIGAVHCVIFAGFSPASISDRIKDAGSRFVITTDFSYRGGKKANIKYNVDEALKTSPEVEKVLLIARNADEVERCESHQSHLYFHYEDFNDFSADCPCEPMNSDDPLFLLYTSGSTNKPKGVLHATGGYLAYCAYTHYTIFDYHQNDIYWCAADVGWVTGHSYIVYGPLANGATSLLFEGLPTHPNASRIWQIVDKYKVNILYTAPTAIRALKKEGDSYVSKTDRSSLRLLGSVGEPINPEAWRWYYEVVGNSQCPIVDTWWQTETGGIMMSALPGATPLKPGSACFPLPGIVTELVNDQTVELHGEAEGHLVIKKSWPGQMKTIYGDHERFEQTYFSTHKGYYFSGDGCRRDADGYYWITGRVDDVLNVSGHRLGTAEIESALVLHPDAAEAAVVAMDHDIKGQAIYAYVVLKDHEKRSDKLKAELIQTVRKQLSPIATPEVIHFTEGLPKTRSGKILRRLLRKIAAGDFESLGDTSTLSDPSVLEGLISQRKKDLV